MTDDAKTSNNEKKSGNEKKSVLSVCMMLNAALTSKIPAAVFTKPEPVVATDRVVPTFLIYGFYLFQVGWHPHSL